MSTRDDTRDSVHRGLTGGGAATVRRTDVRPGSPVRLVPPGRPDRGSARRTGPNGRSRSGVGAPSLVPLAAPKPASCMGEAAPVRRQRVRVVEPQVRLTSRGIAVVLVTGAMLVVAALTVVGATALRVTSDSYQPNVGAVSSSGR